MLGPLIFVIDINDIDVGVGLVSLLMTQRLNGWLTVRLCVLGYNTIWTERSNGRISDRWNLTLKSVR